MEEDSDKLSNGPQPVTYELVLSQEEAQTGVARVLTRNGKRLEVKVPAGARKHQVVRLRNAQRLTDGHDGDILIRLIVQSESSTSGTVQQVTDDTFESEVLHAPIPVLVDFWAPWCGPCQAMAPVTELLASEYSAQMKFCKLNVDENPLASRKYQVASIPAIMLFRDGRIADVSVGAVSAHELRTRIETVLAKTAQ